MLDEMSASWALPQSWCCFRGSFSTSVATCGCAASLKMLSGNSFMTTTGHICCCCRPATSSAAAVQPSQLPSISVKHLASSRFDPLSSVVPPNSPQTQLTAKAGLIKTRSSHSTSEEKKLTNHRKETDADVYSAGWILTSINGVVVHWGAIACSVEGLFAPTTRISGTAPGVVVIGTRSGFHFLL